MLNKVLMSGRLTADPEITIGGDSRYCNFSIAVERPKRKGEDKAEVDFFNCTAKDRNADVVVDWFGKGDMIMFIGTLRNSKYEKNGEKRTATKIRVDEIHFMGGKKKQTEDNNAEYDSAFSEADTLF